MCHSPLSHFLSYKAHLYGIESKFKLTLKNNVHHIDYFIVFVGQDGRPFLGKGRGMGLTQIYHAEARS